MSRILLIGAEPAFSAQLQSHVEAAGIDLQELSDPRTALDHIEQNPSGVRAAVLGTLVEEPVRLAQRIHRLDRDIALLILSQGDHHASVSRALQYTPFLGNHVTSHRVSDILEIAEALNDAVTRSGQRQQFRTTLTAMNRQLQSLSTHRISAVQYLDHVLDHAPVGVVVLGSDAHIISSNRRASEILERRERSLLGASLLELFPESEAERLSSCLAHPGRADSQSRPDVFARQAHTGDMQYVGMSAAALPSESAEPVTLLILQDVTRQIVNEREREAAIQFRDEFLSMAAHELKTPLTSTKGFVDLLGRQVQQPAWNHARIIRLQEQLRAQIDRLELLVSDLLDASHVQHGQLKPHPEPLDLAELARQVLQRYRDIPTQKPRHLFVLEAAETVMGVWDPDRIEQVLTNLVSNAIKYSPDGGEISVTVRNLGDRAEILVQDQGIGIEPELQRRLFEPFMRGNIGGDIPGTGLGLHIASQIVEQHGGTISVDSTPGVGSAFTVRLPLDTSPARRSEHESVPGHPPDAASEQPH